jgi:uncharacterized protein (TIGR02466 family)
MKYQTIDLFATPIFITQFEDYADLNTGIHNELLDYKKSFNNMFDVPGENIKELHTRIWGQVEDIYSKYKWFHPPRYVTARRSLVEPGKCDTPHHHIGSMIVGVYYFYVPENSGDILIHDPRGAISWENLNQIPDDPDPYKTSRCYHRIKPKQGMLIMMPGFLQHSVETNLGNQNRISIVFNGF